MTPGRRAVFAAVLSLGTAARAQQPVRSVTFSWARGDGADQCPSSPELMAAVRARMGRDPFTANASVTAEGSVERVGPRWRVRLLFRDAAGAVLLRRELDDASEGCTTVASAVVLSVSLALAPTGDPVPPRHDAELPPALAPRPATPPVAPRERAWTTLSAEALYGVLPGVAWGAAWRVEVPIHRRWALWGAVMYEPEVAVGAAREWSFGVTRGSVGACWRAWRPRPFFELGLCAGASVGAVHAVTFGPTPLAPGDNVWAAATLDPRATLRPWRALVLEAGATAAWAFARNQFTVQRGASSSSLFDQAPVAVAVSLGAGVEF